MSMKQFNPHVNVAKIRDSIEKVLKDATENWPDGFVKDSAGDYMEAYVDSVVDNTIRSFNTYVHREDTSIPGNFCDIRIDYRREHDGKSFRKVVADIDHGIENADTKEFRDWAVEWFFTAFGTFALKYNWTTFMEEVACDDEEE